MVATTTGDVGILFTTFVWSITYILFDFQSFGASAILCTKTTWLGAKENGTLGYLVNENGPNCAAANPFHAPTSHEWIRFRTK